MQTPRRQIWSTVIVVGVIVGLFVDIPNAFTTITSLLRINSSPDVIAKSAVVLIAFLALVWIWWPSRRGSEDRSLHPVLAGINLDHERAGFAQNVQLRRSWFRPPNVNGHIQVVFEARNLSLFSVQFLRVSGVIKLESGEILDSHGPPRLDGNALTKRGGTIAAVVGYRLTKSAQSRLSDDLKKGDVTLRFDELDLAIAIQDESLPENAQHRYEVSSIFRYRKEDGWFAVLR